MRYHTDHRFFSICVKFEFKEFAHSCNAKEYNFTAVRFKSHRKAGKISVCIRLAILAS